MSTLSRRLLVVRRGDIDRLQRLKEKFSASPVDVIVDRRQQDRRWHVQPWPVERRWRHRRAAWPGKFPSSAFLVVPAELVEDWIIPARGDALVSPSAESEGFAISLISGPVQSRYDTFAMAVEQAKRFARYATTDLRYSEDQLTFVLLETFRLPPPPPPADAPATEA